jgi:hypothetical protein
MRCISCGTEMRLVQVKRDDTMMVPGYARQTLQCVRCNEVEHRLVFNIDTQAQPPDPAPLSEAAAAPLAPANAALSDAEKELDEGEALLRRAIAMVRGPARVPDTANGPAGARPDRPAGLGNSFPAKRSARRRVVQIRHDPSYDAEYAAEDARSGVVVLRHRDRTRLWAMCDRLGWQVDEGTPS